MLRQATYTTPVTALYARLSKDDEQQGESLSIENQKRILETFARDNGFLNCRFFVDDGWSGANFQRPGFMEMMDCVESGEVKCVITKDLSRMGRNYLQVGMFTEITFPKKGVRFIAINDGVDSALISFLRTLVFQVAAILLLPRWLDINGIWLAVTAAESLTLLVTVSLLAAKRRKYHY